MKKVLIGFVFGIILCGSVVYGANIYKSEDIKYNSTDASWEVNNVGEAINSLYNMKNELNTLRGLGTADASQILFGKTAVVKGNTITGTMTNRGAWTSTPTSSGKVTIPAGYHNGSGYVDTTSVYNAGIADGNTNISNVIMEHFTQFDDYTNKTYTVPKNGIAVVSVERNNGYNRSIAISLALNGTTLTANKSSAYDAASLSKHYVFKVSKGDVISITSTGQNYANYNYAFHTITII